jgi:hypothetical protein
MLAMLKDKKTFDAEKFFIYSQTLFLSNFSEINFSEFLIFIAFRASIELNILIFQFSFLRIVSYF